MTNIIRFIAFISGCAWLTTHSPDEWAGAFMGLLASSENAVLTVQANQPAFEAALVPVFTRFFSLFV